MAVRQIKDGRWICYYRYTGTDGVSRQKNEYFGRGAAGEAAAKRRNTALNLKKRRPPSQTHGPTVSQLARSYCAKKHFSANSQKQLAIRLSANILPFFGHRAAIDLTDQIVDDYIIKRLTDPVYNRAGAVIRQGVKNSTITRELTDLQAILNWSKNRRPPLIHINPIAQYKKPAADYAIIAPATAAEIRAIIAAAAPHIIRAIKISYYTGLRPGAVELLAMRWDDIDFAGGLILVRSANKGGPPRRLVAIHDDFKQILRAWYVQDGKSGPVIHYHGRAIKKFGKAWGGTLARAGITRRLRPYDLRHGFITQALENGGDLKAVSELVGSRPETIMRHYQHVSKKLHRDTVARIAPLEVD